MAHTSYALTLLILTLITYTSAGPLIADQAYQITHKNKLWKTSGEAHFVHNGLQLTSGTLNHGFGSAWNAKEFNYHDWEVIFNVETTGMGDDGFAFFVADRILHHGSMFGSDPEFSGLAVVFDSTDNDGLNNNPAVAAHLFDGTQKYDEETDGVSHQLAGCIADYRKHAVSAKIAYSRNTGFLGVYLDLKGTGVFQKCLQMDNIFFSTDSMFLGISGSTGDNPEGYLISSFEVFADGGSEGRILDFESDEFLGDDSLLSIDRVVHSKIDTLVWNAEMNAANALQLGLALDEVEENVMKSVDQHAKSLMQKVLRLRERTATLTLSMNNFRSTDLSKQIAAFTELKTVVQNVQEHNSQILEESIDPIELFKETRSDIRGQLDNYFKVYEMNLPISLASKGMKFWLIVVVLQTLIAIYCSFKVYKSRKYY